MRRKLFSCILDMVGKQGLHWKVQRSIADHRYFVRADSKAIKPRLSAL